MILYRYHPTDTIAHTTAFVTPVVEHWLKEEIAQWVHHEGLIVSVFHGGQIELFLIPACAPRLV